MSEILDRMTSGSVAIVYFPDGRVGWPDGFGITARRRMIDGEREALNAASDPGDRQILKNKIAHLEAHIHD